MSDDLSPDELWVCHLSCLPWSESDRWMGYFGRVEEILGTRITHLDKNDPVRRRVKPGKLNEAAEYVTLMGEREESRWLFGRMESIGVEFTLQHYRENRDIRGWPNSIDWYFPAGFVDNDSGANAVRSLFDCGNAMLSAFYAYADTIRHIGSKKKESLRAVDIQSELLGVFWLSFFDVRYVDFIGKEKFDGLQDVSVKFDRGATLDLGETPSSVVHGLRGQAEVRLGSKLFVEPKEMMEKRPGQYVLTFDRLRR